MAKKHILHLLFGWLKSLSQVEKTLTKKHQSFISTSSANFLPTHLRHPSRASCPYVFCFGRVSAETVDEKLSTLNWCQKKAGPYTSLTSWWLNPPIYEKNMVVKLATISPSLGVKNKKSLKSPTSLVDVS